MNLLLALSFLVQKQLKAPSLDCCVQAMLLVTSWINHWSQGVEQLKLLKALVKEDLPLIHQGDNQQQHHNLLQHQHFSN